MEVNVDKIVGNMLEHKHNHLELGDCFCEVNSPRKKIKCNMLVFRIKEDTPQQNNTRHHLVNMLIGISRME